MKLLLFVGKSGSGKDYLARALGLKRVVSYTTRPMRKGEVDGVDHIFRTEGFFWRQDPDKVLAMTRFNQYYYWVDAACLKDKEAYVIDPKGVAFFKKRIAENNLDLEIRVIYLRTPAWRRFIRMVGRELFKDDMNTLDKMMELFKHGGVVRRALDRIKHDALEFAGFKDYDAVINT